MSNSLNDRFLARLSNLYKEKSVGLAVLIDLTGITSEEIFAATQQLDFKEKKRLAYLTKEVSRRNFVVCRVLTRQLLKEFCNLKENIPAFHYYEKGKPFLPDTSVHFNISHSHEKAVIGISQHPIGVDIEKMNQHRNIQGLVDLTLSSCEKEWVFEKDLTKRFYHLWTLKEARAKCDGDGIQWGHLPQAVYHEKKGWSFPGYKTFNFLADNYSISICLKSNTV